MPVAVRFGSEPEFQQEVSSLLSAMRGGPIVCQPLGESEEGRAIMGYVIGSGPRRVSLIAGSHSDEPVGPETLRSFIRNCILTPERWVRYLNDYTFFVIPHVNPDGEARNRPWIKKWPGLESYVKHAFRELPGRDVEFGYPEMRVENRLVSQSMAVNGPFDLHLSLHGMGFSDGALLLIERHWIDRTAILQTAFSELASRFGFSLHDHDRKGAKGFRYIGPGFTTTPEGAAMRDHFLAASDPETAGKFHDSSMEFVRSLGGDPLCLVTELPLFHLTGRPDNEPPGVPEMYMRFKAELGLARTSDSGDDVSRLVETFKIVPVPIVKAMKMQMAVIEMGLDCLSEQ